MKRSPGSSKTPIHLSPAIQRQLNMYALAASAAGVGLLALAHSAEAKIVYTPANVNIAANTVVPLDVNNDGVADFSFKDNWVVTARGASNGSLLIAPSGSANEIWGYSARNASALRPGVVIRKNGHFQPGTDFMAAGVHTTSGIFTCNQGQWFRVRDRDRYLALKFIINGRHHFGWARLDVICNAPTNSQVTATLSGYAYETVPGKWLRTGQTKDDPPDSASAQGSTPVRELALPVGTLGRLARGR
jgi:hypothetical protein